jgi:hypothetical protein
MIKVNYKGFLGNNMFQNAMERILTTEMGYQLDAQPIIGLPETNNIISCKRYSVHVNYSFFW